MDPMVSRLAGEVAALRAEVAALRRAQPSGAGVSTAFGATSVRPVTTGFAAELTSAYDSTTGYSWKALELNVATPGFENPAVQLTGTHAFAADGNEGLTSGTRVWLERDPTTTGLVVAGSLGGPLQSQEVVTAVACIDDEIVVTTVTITGYFTIEA
jgi:hypothetical protein